MQILKVLNKTGFNCIIIIAIQKADLFSFYSQNKAQKKYRFVRILGNRKNGLVKV